MIAMEAAHGLPHLVVGGRGDGAGIENDQPRVGCGGGGRESFRGEAGLNGGAISLRGAASEVLDEESFHYL
jgi:hypothetical protein